MKGWGKKVIEQKMVIEQKRLGNKEKRPTKLDNKNSIQLMKIQDCFPFPLSLKK